MAHRLAPQVETELENIWYYTAHQSGNPEVADRLIDSITDRFFLIAGHPYAGRRRDQDLRTGLRSFPVGDYVIIYRIQAEDILILHVTHGRRDMGALFNEEL
jgi:toxin ParE1/3/4